MSNKDLTEAWLDWRETCALDKCSPEHISDLCAVSNSMFRRALARMETGTVSIERFSSLRHDEPVSDVARKNALRHTFHLMETELLPAGEKEERQQYKDRIFERAKNAGSVTGYFLRDFFRSFVRKKENRSYSRPELPEDTSPEAEENQQVELNRQNGQLQGQPTPDMIDNELLHIARDFWSTLDEKERAALYAYHYHMTMSDARLLQKVGIGKSVFSAIPLQKIKELVKLAREKYKISDREECSLCINSLTQCYNEWEVESELGRWIVEHTTTPDKPGAKIHFH